MKGITQGTLIYGMRSTKYPGVVTYAVIISAACDLAQDKIDKIFYLTAVPVEEWLRSDKGFQVATAGLEKSFKKSLLDALEKHGLSWDVVRTLSPEEFKAVIGENIQGKSEKDSVISKYMKYGRLTKQNQTRAEKTALYHDENKSIAAFLETIFNGGNSHYAFIPQQAISEDISAGRGLIVDLLELDYLSAELVERINNSSIDCKILSSSEIDTYDARFFLKEEPGFAYPLHRIASPWREYILQHFSSCFIRIGVDNPGKDDAKTIVEALFQTEEQK